MAFTADTSQKAIKVLQDQFGKTNPIIVKAFAKETLSWKKLNYYPNSKGVLFGNAKSSGKMYQIKIHSSVLRKEYQKVLPGTNFIVKYIPTDKAKVSAGGKGKSGKGATRMQEELQCLYTAYRFQLGTDLKASNCNDTHISSNNVIKKCIFVDGTCSKQTAQSLYDDMENDDKTNDAWLETYPKDSPDGKNVFMKIANTIAKHPYAKKFKNPVFHRGSEFTKKIYKAKAEALKYEQENSKGGFVWTDTMVADDKWNPADIWMSEANITEPFCV